MRRADKKAPAKYRLTGGNPKSVIYGRVVALTFDRRAKGVTPEVMEEVRERTRLIEEENLSRLQRDETMKALKLQSSNDFDFDSFADWNPPNTDAAPFTPRLFTLNLNARNTAEDSHGKLGVVILASECEARGIAVKRSGATTKNPNHPSETVALKASYCVASCGNGPQVVLPWVLHQILLPSILSIFSVPACLTRRLYRLMRKTRRLMCMTTRQTRV